MTIHQKIASVFVTLAFILTAVFPERWSSALAIVGTIALYGTLVFLDLKSDAKDHALAKRLNQLEDKMNGLMISKGMGR